MARDTVRSANADALRNGEREKRRAGAQEKDKKLRTWEDERFNTDGQRVEVRMLDTDFVRRFRDVLRLSLIGNGVRFGYKVTVM